MSVLKYLNEMLINEKVYGNIATVYHRAPSDEIVDIIKSNGYRFGGGAGWLYGPGVYTVYELESTLTEYPLMYGDYIIKNKLKVIDFLIFDPIEAKKIYGPNYALQDQWKQITKGQKVKNNDQIVDHLTVLNEAIPTTKYTADLAASLTSVLNMSDIVPYINGLIFTGKHDGKVAVVYNRSLLTPMAVAECGKSCDNPEFRPLSNVKNMLSEPKKKYIKVNRESDRIENVDDWMKWINRQINKGIDMSDNIMAYVFDNKDPDIKKNILTKYYDYITKNSVVKSPSYLNKSLEKNDLYTTDLLLSLGAKPDEETLYKATQKGNKDLINKLLKPSVDAGIGVDALNNIMVMNDRNIIDKLLDLGVEPNTKTLNLALLTGDNELVDRIVDYGVTPDYDTLNDAIKSRDIDLIDKMLNLGAKPNKDTLFHALSTNNDKIIKKMFKLIKQYNIPIHAATLNKAIEMNSLKYVKQLLKMGVLPNKNTIFLLRKYGVDDTRIIKYIVRFIDKYNKKHKDKILDKYNNTIDMFRDIYRI